MSRYDPLWKYVQDEGSQSLKLSFDQIRDIIGTDLDHSFLKYKKELIGYGYEVKKISLKQENVLFEKIG